MGLDTRPSLGFSPPRKWRYRASTGGTLGTLAAPWQDLEIISTLPTEEEDGQELWWQFDHPSVDDNFIRVRWHLFEATTTGSTPVRVNILFEFWHEGTKYGIFNSGDFTDPPFLGADRLQSQNIGWSSLVNPTLFQQINTSFYYAARWTDDPDFQPYRTRP